MGWEDEYHSATTIDRNIMMIHYHYYKNIESYNNLSDDNKEQVMFILFDDLVGNPIPVCSQMANFLGTKKTYWTKKILKMNNCPRIINNNSLEIKYKEIISAASKEKIDILDIMIKDYEQLSNKYVIKDNT